MSSTSKRVKGKGKKSPPKGRKREEFDDDFTSGFFFPSSNLRSGHFILRFSGSHFLHEFGGAAVSAKAPIGMNMKGFFGAALRSSRERKGMVEGRRWCFSVERRIKMSTGIALFYDFHFVSPEGRQTNVRIFIRTFHAWHISNARPN